MQYAMFANVLMSVIYILYSLIRVIIQVLPVHDALLLLRKTERLVTSSSARVEIVQQYIYIYFFFNKTVDKTQP